ncbi:MAG TPA: UbiD family decarboxylase, partial [Acidimicrobiales bacterium]|nr:UbiD family decarboxylase [Acidimicrobiales bacterium]
EPILSLRDAVAYLKATGELLVSENQVDPDVEVVALQKHFDGGAALLFEKVKGYPNARMLTNLTATEGRLARLFGMESRDEFKLRMVEAYRCGVPPRIVEKAPAQEVVLTDDVDVWPVVPMVSHTRQDPGRTLGGGVTFVSGRHFWGGTHIAYNRMNFRGPNWSSFQISPGSHGDMIATEFYKKEAIPMTINVGAPPSVVVTASAGFMYMLLHKGSDELGVAGALQRRPVDIVKAKTVDAYAIAEAEWVIEGYLDTTERVWESEESERTGEQGVHPFHPEWAGYMGKAYRTYKFTATAVTHRADRPIYHSMGVHMKDVHLMASWTREAGLMELADRISPGFCVDVHVPWSMTDWGGAIFQTRKRRKRDEGTQINVMAMALAISRGMKLAIAVDPDIDIYNLDDVMWALSTRVDPGLDIQRSVIGGLGQTFQPSERAAIGNAEWTASNLRFSGGLMIDATVPFGLADAFERPRYPVAEVDPKRFFPDEDILRGRAEQIGWERYLAQRGY